MNLAEYSRTPRTSNAGEFLKFTQNGETKVLRFLYTSHDGADIPVVRKLWDDVQKKYVYDTPDGKLTCTLSAVIYEPGKPPRKIRWERSAAFTEQVCNGYWAKFPRIVDGVWEVTCTNPGTKDIKFSWFPVMGADFTTYPLPEGVSLVGDRIVDEASAGPVNSATTGAAGSPDTSPTSTPTAAARPAVKKYWVD